MARFEVLGGVREVPREEWNALLGAEASPFLEWEWLASLEEAGTVAPERGWAPRPLVAREEGRLVAACPLYVKGHSEGEFVFDWSWADAAERAGLGYYPKLLVGVPFTPVAGARLLVAPGADAPALRAELARALRSVCEEHDLSGAHVNFCLEHEARTLAEAGFLPRIGLQYHWENRGYADFEDWLARFRSKRRNQIRRERRAPAEQGLAIRTFVGDAIPDALFDPVFRFYRSTVDRNPWGRRYLNRRFFGLLRERFRDRLCVVVAFHGGEPVAGTLNVQKGDALYGRYWGAVRDFRHLHFNVCYYAAVEHCIRSGLSRFEPGAGGEYKQMRGFDARPTWSAHWLRDERLHRAVGRFLRAERGEALQVIDWYREHSALKPAGERGAAS